MGLHTFSDTTHSLFYYQVDYLSLQRMCSGLHQVTKTDKMPIRK